MNEMASWMANATMRHQNNLFKSETLSSLTNCSRTQCLQALRGSLCDEPLNYSDNLPMHRRQRKSEVFAVLDLVPSAPNTPYLVAQEPVISLCYDACSRQC
jgi:hypothetical protein